MMLENRLKQYFTSTSTAPLSKGKVSTILERSGLSFEDLLRQATKEAVEAGKRKAYKEVNAQIEKNLNQYIGRIIRIASLVESVTKKFTKIEIAEFRASLHFNSEWIELLFIINCSLEEEFEFVGILSQIEHLFLQEDNVIVESLCVNAKEKKIDKGSLYDDFPFSIPLERVRDAIGP